MEAEKTPNVVQATNRPGLYEELEQIQERYCAIKHLNYNSKILFLGYLFVRRH